MIRLELYPYEAPNSYQRDAWDLFEEYIDYTKPKTKTYKNGIIKIWFKNSEYKSARFFIDKLRVESIPHQVIKLK